MARRTGLRLDRVTTGELEERAVETGRRLRIAEEHHKKLARRIARLEAASPKREAIGREEQGIPEGCTVHFDGAVLNGQGIAIGSIQPDGAGNRRFVPFAAIRETDAERLAARMQSEAAAEDQYWAERTRGLPKGEWRDPCGIVRGPDGRVVSAARAQEEDRARKDHDAELARRQRAALHPEGN